MASCQQPLSQIEGGLFNPPRIEAAHDQEYPLPMRVAVPCRIRMTHEINLLSWRLAESPPLAEPFNARVSRPPTTRPKVKTPELNER